MCMQRSLATLQHCDAEQFPKGTWHAGPTANTAASTDAAANPMAAGNSNVARLPNYQMRPKFSGASKFGHVLEWRGVWGSASAADVRHLEPRPGPRARGVVCS
jgi:hypothetical protein